ncbi:hypothetical protein A2422_01950 [Candidatus Woesebacteria bacterium RIFOXYC1_FULL_31_51]|uniref:Membrane protein involved in the export of O-antigen and teichoic acid n=1 Tax=Candidatus Woesebacteria bacterium GW2011_GWC2_31_9 TaxID=1618586 RepID=A0A0G0BLF2_9BACT|nr:MAG: membrane protein [Candidatus Woesebacteria bacterium GW2011_GWF1_31_35]KKP23609.1 MAG: Membrane protein involved in the export of O-antigen and teichoic acid [Candidatus Woesebacteria bacterium GW2011_GWC1_30_29]KKP27010.1 MAG: Membrane protein involved in the export of O-antigen and teichoic acid [Candidatus Woesebacteria bacterium GW2011_GWD1_31_12]KKP27884.1 MAG: Membrane protein involved in the export of O-antigen and teichoic acid [Candidatus Woesebacteria bacterium GW2011_GWB1_31_2
MINKTNIIYGLSWMGALRIGAKAFAFIKTLILARILSPLQFGIFGIASLVLGFLEIITETGINVVLIQEKDGLEKHISSSWIVSIIRGIFLSLIIFLLTPLISKFFNNPSAIKILYLTAFVPLIRGFINPAEVKFQKNLNFKKEFIFKGILISVEAITAILLGFLTKSELSLICGLIAGALVEVFISLFFISPKPKLIFHLESFKFVIKKGIWITFAGVFNYIFQHGDDLVVGKVLGVYPLGLYQQAYRISSLPVSEMGEIFSKVTFPYYSKYKKDLKNLRSVFLKTFLGTFALVIPFGILIFLFPYQTVNILLGKNWLDTVGVLQILAIFGILKALTNSVFPLFLGIGKQNWITWITLVGILGLGLTIFPLTNKFGIRGTAVSTIIGTIVTIPMSMYWTIKILKQT